MRILVTIPHACLDLPGTARYGSERGDRAGRAAMLQRCVAALRQSFGPQHRLVGPDDPACNTGHHALTVAVCTASDQHVADTLPSGAAYHHRTELHPRLLGFACHGLLKANLGQFDWFGYLEDDLELVDGLFFDKLAWFNATFGPGVMLQPNRYEISDGPVPKLYIDGALANEAATQPFQDITVRPRLEGAALGRSYAFQREANPHSGCFFADAAQMAVMAVHPAFGAYSDEFIGPLESAASLPPMRSFDVYKPARENAAFLEIRHLGQQMLDKIVHYRLEGDVLSKLVTSFTA